MGNPYLWGEAVRIVTRSEAEGKSLEEALEAADEHVNGLLAEMKPTKPARKPADGDEEGEEKPRKSAPKVIGGNRPTGRTGSGSYEKVHPKSALPEDALDVYNKMVKTARNPGGFLSHEDFMKQYTAKGGRLVGQA